MTTLPYGLAAQKSLGATPADSTPDGSMDQAWIVLEAANDLRDNVTVEICRRVIDASLNGRPASPSDLNVLQNYFS